MNMVTRIVASMIGTVAVGVAIAGPAHAAGPVNLRVDDAVRADLVAAGATLKGLPVSDFIGLRPGGTYYAFDPDTGIHWAGARLMPAPTAYEAQVADQDAGSYTLFERLPGQGWTGVNDGYGRGVGGCPAPLPPAIVTLWEWDPTKCKPAAF